jgi:hypothetical protein
MHRAAEACPMNGAQPMSEANALAEANAQRGPRSALAIGYGTTHVIFDPLDFIARLAALIPKPLVSITRFYCASTPIGKHIVSR